MSVRWRPGKRDKLKGTVRVLVMGRAPVDKKLCEVLASRSLVSLRRLLFCRRNFEILKEKKPERDATY